MAVNPEPVLDPAGMPWARRVNKRLDDLEQSATRRSQGETATNKGQNGTLHALAKNIVDLDANVQDAFNNLTVQANQIVGPSTMDQSLVSGTWSKGVSTGNDLLGTNVTGVNVFAQSLSTNITATRVSLWGRTSDGYIATAASSLYAKTRLHAVDLDERSKAILKITVGYFEYLDEIRKRDDPSFADYVGPDYHVGSNLGAIAEQLHELGLWEWVVYERKPIFETRKDADGNDVDVIVGDELALDAKGNPIPFGIHDILIGWAALIVAQYQEKRLSKLEAWAETQGF